MAKNPNQNREAQENLVNQYRGGEYQGSERQASNLQAQNIAQNQFSQNLNRTQTTALDAIRRANAGAIASGANAGLSAANQLSAILGLQQDSIKDSTALANQFLTNEAQQQQQYAQEYQNAIKLGADMDAGEGALKSGDAALLQQRGEEINTFLTNIDKQLENKDLTEIQKQNWNLAREITLQAQASLDLNEKQRLMELARLASNGDPTVLERIKQLQESNDSLSIRDATSELVNRSSPNVQNLAEELLTGKETELTDEDNTLFRDILVEWQVEGLNEIEIKKNSDLYLKEVEIRNKYQEELESLGEDDATKNKDKALDDLKAEKDALDLEVFDRQISSLPEDVKEYVKEQKEEDPSYTFEQAKSDANALGLTTQGKATVESNLELLKEAKKLGETVYRGGNFAQSIWGAFHRAYDTLFMSMNVWDPYTQSYIKKDNNDAQSILIPNIAKKLEEDYNKAIADKDAAEARKLAGEITKFTNSYK